MGKPAPFWKGKFVDRDYLRDLLERGFRKCATGDFDAELGGLVNDLELYVTVRVLEHSLDVLSMVRADVDGASKTMKEMASQIGRAQIQRAGESMEKEDEE